jgi:hypothetical protein
MNVTPEDEKLVTLARSSRARIHAAGGAAVRDLDGRTYVATSVALPSLELSALDLAVAMAISSGAKALEAAAVVAERDPEPIVDGSALRDLSGHGINVYIADLAGDVTRVGTT